AEGWQLAPRAGASGFDHDRTGFALRGAHVQTGCARCHTGTARPAGACESCHRDPHQGRNDGACAECHQATAWSDTATLEQHRRTRMPLTGRHAALDCAQCHRRAAERAFSDVPLDCYACHRTEFHAATIHPIHDGTGGSAPLSRDCGQCHRPTGWQPALAPPETTARSPMRSIPRSIPRSISRSTMQLAEHDAKFTLTTGSHRSAECASCHPDARRAQLVRCDGCHGGAALRTQHRMPFARSTAACLGCHPRGAAR
ncbi:MAG: cytochrome c3 family protein, partial [Solirubrobacteraceae bacterium]